jgi:tRNA/rRNA methyltransferase
MKNLGLHDLVLVNPQCEPLSVEAKLMAVHAVDVLEAAQRVATLPQALQDCTRAIATTTRARTLATQMESPRTALPWLISKPGKAALIFGPEYRGLSNEELNYAQRFVRIPSSPAYPSLNLAQAVAICCYELSQSTQQMQPNADTQAAMEDCASLDDLEGYYQQLEALLLKIGYLYPHTAASRMEKLRPLFNRAQLKNAEVAMLRGILTQMEWALSLKGARDEGRGAREEPHG